MYRQNRALLTIILFVTCSRMFSQIIASSTVGCAGSYAPLLSGPAGATNIYWNLGVGQGTASTASTSPIYNSPGSYNVTYTAIVGGSPVSYNLPLLVHPLPTASFNFQIPSSHCAPMTVTFTGSGGGPNTTFSWAFGDLTPVGSGANITHVYTFKNSFTPVMIIKDVITTCTNVATGPSPGIIHVSDPPTLNITSSNGWIGCAPPFSTNIDGSLSSSGSPLGPNLTFNWTFAGGTPGAGSGATPGSVTFGQGTSTVTLVATDDNQCSSTQTVAVSVENPTATATLPGTVCLGSYLHAIVTTPQNNVKFTVSGVPGSTSFSITPNVQTQLDSITVMNTPGPHTVIITVQASPSCPSYTIAKTVFVEEVVANFTNTPIHASCDPSLAITYLNTSSVNSGSSLTYTWNIAFYPNASHNAVPMTTVMSTSAPANFTITQGSLNPYTIYGYFMPIITLVAQSSSVPQCSASIKIGHFDTLARPTAWFNTDVKQGCTPLTVNFRDTSFYAPSMSIAPTSYTWNNGATPPTVITGTNRTAFTYTTGTYYPYLIVQTINGCIDTSFYDTIIVVPPPKITATFPGTVCAGSPVTIVMSGTATTVPASSTITHWHAETDKGFFSGCVNDPTPTWNFTHPGTHSVIVSGYQAGCKTTDTISQTITVLGPVGKFNYETQCGPNRQVVTFTVHLLEASSSVIDFGDNAQQQITGNVAGSSSIVLTHTYLTTGDFTVTLNSVNNGNSCPGYVFKRVVKVRDPKIEIRHFNMPVPDLPNALACTKSPYGFSASMTDIVLVCRQGASWDFKSPVHSLPPVECDHGVFRTHVHSGMPVISDPVFRDTFRVAGIYTISVTGYDDNGCVATTTKMFRISEAVPHFTWNANPACYSDNPIQIINNSQSFQVPPDVMTTYTWTFGDNSAPHYSGTGNDNPVHHYGIVQIPSQVFTVMSVGKNSMGCIDTTIQSLQINNPYPGFVADNLFPCLPKNGGRLVNFSAMSGYATYSVNYGDPPTAWQTSGNFNGKSHYYSTPGTYTTVLTVQDAAGCKATNEIEIKAIGQPTASFKFETGNQFCIPGEPKIKSTSLINKDSIDNYVWTLGTISSPPSYKDSLETIITVPGTYTVALTVSVGENLYCPSTASALIHVYDTKANMQLDKTVFCLGETIKATAKDLQDVAKWQWFFGDLVPQQEIFNTQFAPNPVSYPYVIYPSSFANGKAVVTLKYSSPGDGCVKTATTAIQVIKIEADFEKDGGMWSHCLGLTDAFTQITPNPLNLKFHYFWDFGNGNKTTGEKVLNMYTAPGSFPVTLQVRDTTYHCHDTVVKQVVIFPNPAASIFINDSLVCPRDTFFLSGGGAPGVVGQLTATLTSSEGERVIGLDQGNQFNIPLQVVRSDTFSLKVKDQNGCEAKPVSTVIAVPEPAPSVHTSTAIIIGQSVQLNAGAGSGFSFSWTPEVTALQGIKVPDPVSTTTTDITYSVQIVDEPLRCFLTINTFSIQVLPLTTVDVPSAFTPNGDGINDIVYPAGWGIRKLNYFRIFNRWGQLIFESNDLLKGWDGTFEGTPQNTETYVWQVEVQTWVDSDPVISKTGTIKLLR